MNHGVTIDDCRFDGAACRDWRMWGVRVTGCSFVAADLREAAVGIWSEQRRNEWRQVDFSRADFRVTVSKAALYEECTFDSAKLTSVIFEQCALVRCHFAGALVRVTFDGRVLPDRAPPYPMEDVDFTHARLPPPVALQ